MSAKLTKFSHLSRADRIRLAFVATIGISLIVFTALAISHRATTPPDQNIRDAQIQPQETATGFVDMADYTLSPEVAEYRALLREFGFEVGSVPLMLFELTSPTVAPNDNTPKLLPVQRPDACWLLAPDREYILAAHIPTVLGETPPDYLGAIVVLYEGTASAEQPGNFTVMVGDLKDSSRICFGDLFYAPADESATLSLCHSSDVSAHPASQFVTLTDDGYLMVAFHTGGLGVDFTKGPIATPYGTFEVNVAESGSPDFATGSNAWLAPAL